MGKNLVTGGFGFMGRYLARQLIEEGEEVVLFQRRRTPPPGTEDLKNKVTIVSGDVSNWVHVLDVIKNNPIDCIYHTAALLVRDCEESPAAGYRVNVEGTFNLLEAARIFGVQNFIFVSSAFIYCSNPPRMVFDDILPRPTLMYATTKVCCEPLGEYYHRKYSLNFRGIRFPMVIGPGREISYFFGDFTGSIETPAHGKPYIVHSDESRAASLIYVKDAAKALIDLRRTNQNKLRQRVYNAQGFTATLREVVETVKKCLPEAQIEFALDSTEEMRLANRNLFYEIDNSSAKEDFGWDPCYNLEKMVEDFIKEIRAGRAG